MQKKHTISVIIETRPRSTISVGELGQVSLHECFGGLDNAGFIDGAGILVCPDIELVAVFVEIGVCQRVSKYLIQISDLFSIQRALSW